MGVGVAGYETASPLDDGARIAREKMQELAALKAEEAEKKRKEEEEEKRKVPEAFAWHPLSVACCPTLE
jgi:hypothetical protein